MQTKGAKSILGNVRIWRKLPVSSPCCSPQRFATIAETLHIADKDLIALGIRLHREYSAGRRVFGQIEGSQTNVSSQIDYSLKPWNFAYNLPVYFVGRNFMERGPIRTCLTQCYLSSERTLHADRDDSVWAHLPFL